MTKKQADDLTESIRTFGMVDPIIVNRNPARENVVIGGHQRLRVAMAEGLGSVPVVYLDLTEEQERELNLRLNNNQGQWDWDALANFDQALLEKVGFDSADLDKIFRDIDGDDDYDTEKAASLITEPKAKSGDLYQLGEHYLFCGDSTDPKSIQSALAGSRADMVFTDPPYNVNYEGAGKKTSRKIENDSMEPEEFQQFLTKAFAAMTGGISPQAPLYVCYASRTHREFENALNQSGFKVRNQIIWVKKVASMGWGDYRWKHEPILYCVREGNKTNFYGDRSQYTTWDQEMTDEDLLRFVKKGIEKDESGRSTVWRLGRDSNYDHPTQKPVQLVTHAIRNSSKRGDLVLDPFGGGGDNPDRLREHRETLLDGRTRPPFCRCFNRSVGTAYRREGYRVSER